MPLTAHGEQSALRSHRTPNTAASTAPLPASVTIMIRPSGGVGCESSRCDLGQMGTEIFFGKSEIRLDSPVKRPPDGQITTRRREQIPLVSRTRCSVLPAMPTRRANARPTTGSASSGHDAPQAGTYIDTSKVGPGSAGRDTPALPQKDNRHFRDYPPTRHISDITKPTRFTHKRHYLCAEVRCP